MGMFKRWAVSDGIAGSVLPERFFFRKDAQDLRDAVEFLYVLDSTDSVDPLTEEDYELLQVVRV